MVERLLPSPEIRGWNPANGNFNFPINCIEKKKLNKMYPGRSHFKEILFDRSAMAEWSLVWIPLPHKFCESSSPGVSTIYFANSAILCEDNFPFCRQFSYRESFEWKEFILLLKFWNFCWVMPALINFLTLWGYLPTADTYSVWSYVRNNVLFIVPLMHNSSKPDRLDRLPVVANPF